MQDASHMNFVVDLTHRMVSVPQWYLILTPVLEYLVIKMIHAVEQLLLWHVFCSHWESNKFDRVGAYRACLKKSISGNLDFETTSSLNIYLSDMLFHFQGTRE